MYAIINKITENNLQELKGLSIEGEIPVSEEFLNGLIKSFMESAPSKSAPQPSFQSQDKAAGGIDFSKIMSSLDKKEIYVSLKEKQAILKISIKKF
jgi:hypothetical protein